MNKAYEVLGDPARRSSYDQDMLYSHDYNYGSNWDSDPDEYEHTTEWEQQPQTASDVLHHHQIEIKFQYTFKAETAVGLSALFIFDETDATEARAFSLAVKSLGKLAKGDLF